MSESEPKRETLDQQPFVIRAHHLYHYTIVVMSGDPSGLAKIIKLGD